MKPKTNYCMYFDAEKIKRKDTCPIILKCRRSLKNTCADRLIYCTGIASDIKYIENPKDEYIHPCRYYTI